MVVDSWLRPVAFCDGDEVSVAFSEPGIEDLLTGALSDRFSA